MRSKHEVVEMRRTEMRAVLERAADQTAMSDLPTASSTKRDGRSLTGISAIVVSCGAVAAVVVAPILISGSHRLSVDPGQSGDAAPSAAFAATGPSTSSDNTPPDPGPSDTSTKPDQSLVTVDEIVNRTGVTLTESHDTATAVGESVALESVGADYSLGLYTAHLDDASDEQGPGVDVDRVVWVVATYGHQVPDDNPRDLDSFPPNTSAEPTESTGPSTGEAYDVYLVDSTKGTVLASYTI